MNARPFLAALDGEHTNTDACQYCNADIEIKMTGRVSHMIVKHDDDCPLWVIIQETK